MTTDFLIADCLPWLLSAMTIWMTVLQGRKSAAGWIVGLCNQIGWLVFQVGTETWGLLPLNAVLWVLYIRNYRLWRASDKKKAGVTRP